MPILNSAPKFSSHYLILNFQLITFISCISKHTQNTQQQKNKINIVRELKLRN